jgi:hypothetical protein
MRASPSSLPEARLRHAIGEGSLEYAAAGDEENEGSVRLYLPEEGPSSSVPVYFGKFSRSLGEVHATGKVSSTV